MKIETDKTIILRISPIEENIIFLRETIIITYDIFFDDRLPTYQLIKENPEEFNLEHFGKLLEKSAKIKETEIYFNINEFLYLAQIIDFVAKCFIKAPIYNDNIITIDMKSRGVNIKKFKKWYWTKSTNLFQDFRENCKNEKLLKRFNDILNNENKIWKNTPFSKVLS